MGFWVKSAKNHYKITGLGPNTTKKIKKNLGFWLKSAKNHYKIKGLGPENNQTLKIPLVL